MHEPLSPQTLQGYRSAIVDLYTPKNMTLESEATQHPIQDRSTGVRPYRLIYKKWDKLVKLK